MATIQAFIKIYKIDIPAKVRFRLRAGREVNVEYTSDIEILPKYWDSKIQSIKVSPFYSISDKLRIDSEISELRKLITTIFINVENTALLSSKYLSNQIKLSLDKKITSIRGKNIEEIIEQPLKEVTNFFDVFDYRKHECRK